jgi:hypothetical protein
VAVVAILVQEQDNLADQAVAVATKYLELEAAVDTAAQEAQAVQAHSLVKTHHLRH